MSPIQLQQPCFYACDTQSDVSQTLKKPYPTASGAQMKDNYDSIFARHQPEELSGED